MQKTISFYEIIVSALRLRQSVTSCHNELFYKVSWLAVFFFILNFVPETVNAKIFTVKSSDEYLSAEALAKTGDTIRWAAGTFHDVILKLSKDGIHIMAYGPGETVFTGKSSAEIIGSRITFSGFQFIGGKTDGDVFKVRGSFNRLAHLNFSDYHSRYYLNVVPGCQHNTIIYCNFEKKPEDIQSSVVQIQADEKIPGYHMIQYCSFKNHTAPPDAGGDYGIEALRIGYSFQSKFISRTIVEYCYFHRCNGDGEVISSKARENIYRYNTFDDNGESHLTLRHGSDNIVYGNFFLKGSGIRIKEGQNQMVYNNYFNTGDYWAVRLENYKADPLRNIVIAHNTFAGSGPLLLGGKGDFQPVHVMVSRNLFYQPSWILINDMTNRESFSDNVVSGFDLLQAFPGFQISKTSYMENGAGYIQPTDTKGDREAHNSGLQILDIPELDDDPMIKLDILGNKRPGKNKFAGCFEPGKKSNILKPFATELNTGPYYLQVKSGLINRVISNIREETIKNADDMMFEKPGTVTDSFCKRSAGGKHDFYSEGDYWWPDPANPDGPYIQKDGQSNPDNFSDHRHAMIRLCEITATLTSAWLLTGDPKYPEKALEHLNAWFADSATMMNPNMLYAQAIWGRFTGRGIGLIDAYHLTEVAQSVKILKEKNAVPQKELDRIILWFQQFLVWMTSHQYGIDEMNAKNNHGTCWIVTAASMASLVGDEEIMKMCSNRFKNILLPFQMAGNGSFPLELNRTKPYGYSLFNIDAFCNAAQILSSPEDDLWKFRTEDGRSLKKGMEFIFPYIADKSEWPYEKDIYIWEEWPVRQSSLLFAGLSYANEYYIRMYNDLPGNPDHPEVIRNMPVRHPAIWLLE